MPVRTRALVLVTLLAVSAAVGATPVLSAESPPDLSTPAGAQAYLRSIGVDPADAVIQQGLLNYAGPACPGGAWSCVPAAGPVVQISDGGRNVFESAADDPNSCVVVQSNTTGPNEATCARTTSTNGVTQKARITQSNQAGANSADVDLVAHVDESVVFDLTASFDQTIRQETQVTQTNQSGTNAASVLEDADLNATGRALGNGSSLQDAYGIAIVEQRSTTGGQSAQVTQDQDITSSFFDITGGVEQQQQTRAEDGTIVAFLTQATADGINDADLTQDHTLTMVADNVLGTVTEVQAGDAAAMLGDVDQVSDTGTSHYDAVITKQMVADDDADVATQSEDPECCDLLNLVPHTPTTCTISEVVRVIGPAIATQDAFLHGRAFAESNCDVGLSLLLQKGKTAPTIVNEQRSGTFVDVAIECEDGACTSGDRVPETTSANGNLHLAIRNQSDGQGFSSTDAQRPNFTDADPGEILELKISFHNHTTKPIENITLSMPVPAGTTFLDCKACVSGAPNSLTGRVVFNRGTGEAGGTRTGTFRVRADGPSGLYTTQAAAGSSSGSIDSNIVRYWIS